MISEKEEGHGEEKNEVVVSYHPVRDLIAFAWRYLLPERNRTRTLHGRYAKEAASLAGEGRGCDVHDVKILRDFWC